jgi:PAS domain S-box-containing protein
VQTYTRSPLLRYGVAVGAVAVSLGFKLLLTAIEREKSPFIFFLASVLVSAWYGGRGPGLLATALSIPLIDFFFLEPAYTFDFGWHSGNSVSLLLLAVEGIAISSLMGSLYDARETARARARELQSSEERYRRIVETAHEGIWGRDVAGRIDYVNPRMAQLLGYSAAEMLGRPWWDFLDAQDRLAAQGSWERRRRGVTEQQGFRFRRKDGSVLWAIVSTNPKFDEQGMFTGALGMLTDITPLKEAEADLRRAKGELEARVAERTAELHKAKEAAEAANRAKSDFLANVSHEIRNPMNVLLVTTDLLLESGLTPKQTEYLHLMKVSANSLLNVVNDLLDISKIEAGKLVLDAVPFELGACLGKALQALALQADRKGLELACYLDPNAPEVVVGDPHRLGQILTNLVGNAVKFTERGEVVVRVSVADDKVTRWQGDKVTKHQSDASITLSPCHLVTLSFEVRDTGIGIPADKLETIFQPFEQADTSTTRKYGGTGLGLSIAARLVALMGGRIWVESVVGRGSAFHFTARFEVSQSLMAGLSQLQRGNLRDVRVLVVEDNATCRGLLAATLEDWQMRPTAVDGAGAALEAVRRAAATGEPFPLAILDAHLPDPDGFALADQLHRQPGWTGAVILMVSATDASDPSARAREPGIRGCLTKPLLPSELRRTLLAALKQQPGEQANGTPEPSATCTRPLRILVAEDNVINQILMVDLLEKLGHAVVTAGSGPDALVALERQPFDAVLLDVAMPGMSGLEVAAQVRKREKTTGTHVAVIAVTACGIQGDRERCLAAGMDDYLVKPVQTAELLAALARLAAFA